METLEVSNFLTIKKAEIVIKRINIIIGSQATGKSIIAKLVFVFQSFLSKNLYQLVRKEADEQTIINDLTNYFKSIFPAYAWVNQDFSINYKINDITITVQQIKSNDERLLNVFYSSSFLKLINQARSFGRTWKGSLTIDTDGLVSTTSIIPRAQEYICESIFRAKSIRSVFIPAGRSFFATIQQNIFLLLENSANLDPFLKMFGFIYEQKKSGYENSNQSTEHYDDDQLRLKLEETIKKILTGEYQRQNQEDWIYNPNTETRVKLTDASSGQQESLPMLLILSTVPFSSSSEQLTSFFIEEPEAHLFPSAQKSITELFSLLYNGKNSNFFITTHSPYILTALNVLIKAGNTYDSTNNPALHEKINAIVDKQLHIKFEDVAAYTIKDGILESIVNEDLQIIGSSIIDSVSDEFESEYNALLDLEYE